MAAGLLIALFGRPSPGVPHWVAYTACAVFFLGGLAVSAAAFGHPSMNRYLGPLLIACMTAIPTWIAFGPGPRHCSGWLSFLGIAFRSSTAPSDIGCRVAFGVAAVLMWVLLISATVRLVRGKK